MRCLRGLHLIVVLGFSFLNLEIAYAENVSTPLPDAVTSALKSADVSTNNVAIYVQALAANPSQLETPLLAHLTSQPLNPASNMKLLTSYAALALLGPSYRWQTNVYYDGTLKGDTLIGNLYIKGVGDPNITLADFNTLLSRVYQSGIHSITGDIVIDNSDFASIATNAASFDGEPLRAYNATASAFVVNGKVSAFKFDTDDKTVTVSVEPALPAVKLETNLTIVQGDCNAWRNQLRYIVTHKNGEALVRFSGNIPKNCSDKYLELLALDENQYHVALFTSQWRALGGHFNGKLRTANLPLNAIFIAAHTSQSLAETLIPMNKWSNNLMARQLLLTIAATQTAKPATEEKASAVVQQWFASLGLPAEDIVIENGAGLSRIERMSAAQLGSMLVNAYYSPTMPELMASLPILAIDGTMRNRLKNTLMQGRGHFKTGSINGVFSLAGYLLSQNGQRYVVVFMANDPNASLTKPAQDALLEWVYLH